MRLLALCFTVLAVVGAHPVPAHADPVAASSLPSAGWPDELGATFVPVTPTRVLDTRGGAAVGPRQGAVVELAGHLPASATAAVFTLTGTEPTADTHVELSLGLVPWGPSNLNLQAGETRANLVTFDLPGGTRQVHLYNNAGTVHLLADLVGYYTTDEAARYTTTSPTRVLDTRAGAPVGPGSTREVDLSAHVPASATAVTFTLTGTEPTAATHVIAHASGTARPGVSNLNLAPGRTTPNLVTVAIGADRRITLYNHAGTAHLLVDLLGYYATDHGHRFFPVKQVRTVDTRESGGPVHAGGTRVVELASRIPESAAAAVLNLTGTNTTEATYVSAYRTGADRPATSALNLVPGRDTANAAVVAIGGDARLTLYNNAGSTDLVVDLAGFFATPPPCTADCLYTWGNGYGTTPVRRPWLSGVTDVAQSGGTAAYAVKSDGTVWAWGGNQSGQLGTGVLDHGSAVPLRVPGLGGVTAVDVDSGTAYARKSDGTVWAWGSNRAKQIGPDEDAVKTVPVPVSGLSGVTAVAAAPEVGYALKDDGTVWAWGSSASGGLGGGVCHVDHCPAGTPVRVALPLPGTTAITAIAAGNSPTGYALRSDGTVWAWGQDWSGETGTGATSPATIAPTRVVGLTDVVAIAAGDRVAYAVTADGRLWAWGDDEWGTLGTGSECAGAGCRSTVPVEVPGLTDVVAIDSHQGVTLAVRSDGAVWAWGRNDWQGNVGNGTSGHCYASPRPADCRVSVPVRTALTGATALAASGALGQYAVVPG
ncbi:RCC1 domain-containing protein [Actinosynnema sp. NPDC091369]